MFVALDRRYIELFLHSDPGISAGGYSSFEGLSVLLWFWTTVIILSDCWNPFSCL